MISVVYLAYNRAYRTTFVVVTIVLGSLLMLMSLISRRFLPLFALPEALTTSLVLPLLLSRTARRIPSGLLPSAALAFGLLLIWPYPKSVSAFQCLTGEVQFPVEVCNF